MRDIRTLAHLAGGRDEAELAASQMVPERSVDYVAVGTAE